ncbi:unnamed protein product [Orchesella dallaii]|uniref:Cytochrome c peroxidase, mitochondrial n=1 Tax=Orchesella dallaii TaxID=48710 RepID=A0ABP1RI95_9HEXA
MASSLRIFRLPIAVQRLGKMTMSINSRKGGMGFLRLRQSYLNIIHNFASGGGTGEEKDTGAGGSRKSGSKYGSGGGGIWAILAGAGGAASYYYWESLQESGLSDGVTAEMLGCDCKRTIVSYQKVYNAIAKILEEDPDYDDGSYGPVFIRLAWHSSGTYSKEDQTGGSNKGTMRFEPESKYNSNKGLEIPRNKLEKVKEQFPWISYGDLWTLAAVCSVQEMGGPTVPWKAGRCDGTSKECAPDGRLPNCGDPCAQQARDIFYRMGFEDKEIVALIGAHALGRCHVDRSGFDGPWTASPTTFSNGFYTELLGKTWKKREWDGLKQYEDEETKELMMTPADMSFKKDCKFRKWVKIYAENDEMFREDFSKAYKKLLEVGVPFPEDATDMILKSTK